MKKYFAYSLLLAFLGMAISSCYKDHNDYFDTTSDGAMAIASGLSPGFFNLQDGPDAQVSFSVDLRENSAAVNSVTVIKNYNGGSFVEHATLNSFPATVTVTLAEAAAGLTEMADVDLGDVFRITFRMNLADGSTVSAAGAGTIVSIPVSCVSDLAGMYSVTTTYIYHDFLPAFDVHTFEAEIVREGDGIYSTTDFSGGLYSEGPYTTAYGTTGLPVTFSNVCGNINWSGQSDPWGPIVPADGSNNMVDSDGVITIHWYCEAYGEEGISVYTPL
jgi:hypothetical protein